MQGTVTKPFEKVKKIFIVRRAVEGPGVLMTNKRSLTGGSSAWRSARITCRAVLTALKSGLACFHELLKGRASNRLIYGLAGSWFSIMFGAPAAAQPGIGHEIASQTTSTATFPLELSSPICYPPVP